MPSDEKIREMEEAIRKRAGGGKADWNSMLRLHKLIGTSTAAREGYEYLDNTADIQLHAWGETFQSALEHIVICMFGYMTSIDLIQDHPELSRAMATNVEATGHDEKSLVYNFLDEWLFIFHDQGFVPNRVVIHCIDRTNFSIHSSATGETFDSSKHSKGTEIKAITYSNMQIQETKAKCDIWVIVDI